MPKNQATGRRLGRLQGKIDDIGLELSAMLVAERGYSEEDTQLTEALTALQNHLGSVADGLEVAIQRVNSLGRR